MAGGLVHHALHGSGGEGLIGRFEQRDRAGGRKGRAVAAAAFMKPRRLMVPLVMGVLSFLSTVKMAFLAKLLQYLHSPLCDLPSIVPGKAARAFQCVHEEARLQGLA